MEKLNKKYCLENLAFPARALDQPVRVVQFGTGVLLRGLVDHIFQQAFELGYYQGRIAMVKSTSPEVEAFRDQDNIYTVVVTGLDSQQKPLITTHVITCIDRVISATLDESLLKNLFISEDLEIVVSNVTEIGFDYKEETLTERLPSSFPGKLTALLYHRFMHFRRDLSKGLSIIPTELLTDNGRLLRELVFRHARYNSLEAAFFNWLDEACDFCDSLVDRIVPGKLKPGAGFIELPYEDGLAVQTEPYYLWAIRGNSSTKKRLPFAEKIPGLIVADDIQPFREQKLRLLNGCHTALSPVAFQIGCQTVGQMMGHPLITACLDVLGEKEILPTLAGLAPDARNFFEQMKTRWRNPYIVHELRTILAQSTTKMQARNGETFVRYYQTKGALPEMLCFGFAAFLYLFRPNRMEEGLYFAPGSLGADFEVKDQKAALLFQHWQPYYQNQKNIEDIVPNLLLDSNLFEHSFTRLPGLVEKITALLLAFQKTSVSDQLSQLLNAVPQHA